MTKQIQYCTCKVNLAGQGFHVVNIDQFNPVTWPEIQVLQAVHGEENVMDIMPCGVGEVWPTEEKNRLITKYGHRVVEACFPGRAFRMDYMMTEQRDLPQYDGGTLSTKVPTPANGDDHDDGEDEDEPEVAAEPNLDPIFKPSPRGRRSPPPPTE